MCSISKQNCNPYLNGSKLSTGERTCGNEQLVTFATKLVLSLNRKTSYCFSGVEFADIKNTKTKDFFEAVVCVGFTSYKIFLST